MPKVFVPVVKEGEKRKKGGKLLRLEVPLKFIELLGLYGQSTVALGLAGRSMVSRRAISRTTIYVLDVLQDLVDCRANCKVVKGLVMGICLTDAFIVPHRMSHSSA